MLRNWKCVIADTLTLINWGSLQGKGTDYHEHECWLKSYRAGRRWAKEMTLTKYLLCSRYCSRHIMSLKWPKTCDSFFYMYKWGKHYYIFILVMKNLMMTETESLAWAESFIHPFIHRQMSLMYGTENRAVEKQSRDFSCHKALTCSPSLHWRNWTWDGRLGLEPSRRGLSRHGLPVAGSKRRACCWGSPAAPEGRPFLVWAVAACLVRSFSAYQALTSPEERSK